MSLAQSINQGHIWSAGNRSKYFSRGIGKDQSVLLPEVKEVPIMKGKLFDLLPALPLNNFSCVLICYLLKFLNNIKILNSIFLICLKKLLLGNKAVI
jgi:hypothetical protein